MSHVSRKTVAVLFLLITFPLGDGCFRWGTAVADEIQLADDAPGPLSVEESQKLFRVPAGFRVEIVASEPYVADPVAMAFDAQGRILVCEIHGYNLEGYLDILELNKTGQLDRQVRRVPASDDAIRRAAQDQYGTVKRLEDTDGDGRFDRSTVLADRLPPCYGVVPARDGVIVLCAPDIVYLGDTNDDGQTDVREVLFTGFGVGDLWTRINSPRWGIDNWIYGVSGMNSGGTIRGPHLPKDVELGSVCFRFKADGSALEPESGWTHGFGQALDDWGDRFLCTNQQHVLHVVPLPHRYLMRNPFYAAPDLTCNVSGYGHPARVYPTSQPDPWRRLRAADPQWVKFYGEAETTANGFFTAASGQTIYRAREFPAEFYGNHFSVDNAQNMIHRCLLNPDGVSYTAQRPDPNEQCEFLTSTEQWFRPVNLLTGPDGMLYVVDMYRDIIEDYSAIPRHLQQVYIRSLIAGGELGRIWRIVPEPRPVSAGFNLAQAPSAELVTCLTHENAWWRETAQRLLVERRDQSVAAPLRRQLRQAATAQGRLHTLYVLAGLDLLTPEMACAALQDPEPLVKVHALRLAERWLEDPRVLQAALDLEQDTHPRVRLQTALSLGGSNAPAATAALGRMACGAGSDAWLQAAIVSSAANSADRLVETLVLKACEPPASDAQAREAVTRDGLFRALCSVIGARRAGPQLAALLVTLSGQRDRCPDSIQTTCLEGLLEGLQRANPATIELPEIVPAVEQLLRASNDDIRRLTLQVASQLQLNQLPEMQTMFATAREMVSDEHLSLSERVKSVELLAAAPADVLQAVVNELTAPQQPIELQLAGVRCVGLSEQPETVRALLEAYAQFTPQLQAALLDVVFLRQSYLRVLLAAMEEGTVRRNCLDAARRERLTASRDAEIAAWAQRILADETRDPDRQLVLDRYQAALQLQRDASRGQAVFERQCSKCHKLGGQGYEVGPDLLTARTRADETIVSDILDPSSQITVGYNTYNVLTTSGRIFSGVLVSEAATSLTLRAEQSKDAVILRQEIDELATSTISMMPEKLDQEVSPQDVADLLGFLRRSLADSSPRDLLLFDDDPKFPLLLTEGDGVARLVTDDRYRGAASLAIRPPQRFSAAIPGWQYPIAEKPGSGEYRYLRFAWKQADGNGVMLELATDGQWPAADVSRQRYYSGRNETPWQATCVSPDRPTQWTVVTRDLWQDVGPCTLTGIAPTAFGGEALFDNIQLLRMLEDAPDDRPK
ncbi:MAG: PVC-type heme-binding CxxCH protein [Pirellulaceae bacterium]